MQKQENTPNPAGDAPSLEPSQSEDPTHEIVLDELGLLGRVGAFLQGYRPSRPPPTLDYERQLISVRDQIGAARMEDVPTLLEEMQRLQGIAARRVENVVEPVDPKSPYFGHVRLDEEGRGVRDVLIGKTTLIDAKAGVRIVDWRHAPVSQIYYKYEEGGEYEETLGDREAVGEVLVRRTVTILEGGLRRVSSPQGTFVRKPDGWKHINNEDVELSGGQGTAVRPSDMRGVLGIDDNFQQREDRHLPEIAALLDPRQFELISKPNSGLVVIQGGAGSGKTTIGIHRLAYLAYQSRQRFSADKLLVVVGSPALRAYISEALPALGIGRVPVETFSEWARAARRRTIPWLDAHYEENTPALITRFKTHPVMLRLLEKRAEELCEDPKARRDSRGVLWLWAEVLTDLDRLQEAFAKLSDPDVGPESVKRAWRWCSDRCPAILDRDPGDRAERKAASKDEEEDAVGADERGLGDERATLDEEDDALILRASQLLRGELRKGKQPLVYEHLFVDEAQDLAPVDLAVLLGAVRPVPGKEGASGLKMRSATLAGDTAQRLQMDHGFTDWREVLDDLGLSRVDVEPLRIAYRSTKQVLEVARAVLGHLADPDPPHAPRGGAPVEWHEFPSPGAAVAFLGDALRPLFAREPMATVAILARHVEQADVYYEALRMADIPHLRRVRSYDFAFKPGVEVTEIRQVKGLEYDYVIIVDVNRQSFPIDDESRHLLHIAATRAAHQLWMITTGERSALLPDWLT